VIGVDLRVIERSGFSSDSGPGFEPDERGDFFIIEGRVDDVDVLVIRSVVVDFGITTNPR